ncbi:MAG TPA: hypothetical protein VF647_11835 [Longimicrobium sp.]|jgi:hypothetical protein
MITTLFAVLQLAGGPPPVDSASVYALLLQGVRAEYADARIVLSETRSGVGCMPHCGASVPDESPITPEPRQANEATHGPALVAQLREKKLIDGTCSVSPRVYGCAEATNAVFVGLGEIAERPEGSPPPAEGPYWVRVAILDMRRSPPSRQADEDAAHPVGFGYWALVREQEDGTWRVVRRLPAFSL